MKRNNKKGFTIVELVIVIAVIAILSAVLIPTFGGITEKANNSARDQEAKNVFTNYLIACDATPVDGYILVKDGNDSYYYEVKDGQIDLTTEEKTATAPGTVVWCNNHADGTDVDNHNCDNCGIATECGAAKDTCTVEGCKNKAPAQGGNV